MEIVAHGLWAASAVIAANRSVGVTVKVGWAVWWAAFPDVFAFGPSFVAGLWLRATGALDPASVHGGVLPHVDLGLPLYSIGHSLLVFLLAIGLITLLTRRIVVELLGWLLHILIDIPTHSFSYYATRFLWPISDYRIDGIAWWTPWFWITTYGVLAIVYFVIWRKGWLKQSGLPIDRLSAQRSAAVSRSDPS